MNPVLRALGRRLRLGRDRRRAGLVHRAGASHRGPARRPVRDRGRSALQRCRTLARRGAGSGIAADRAYADWRALLDGERARADGADAVAVMTPNDSHHAICAAALERGYDVICDKPLTTNLADALDLVRRVRASGRVFCVTHNYTAYPMVRHARDMVRAGADRRRAPDPAHLCPGPQRDPGRGRGRNPNWRFDPAKIAGPSLVLGDIGTHAHHLGAFVSGQELTEVMAEVWASVPGRTRRRHRQRADALVGRGARHDVGDQRRGRRGARARHAASSAPTGGLEWHQEQPNELRHRKLDGTEVITTRRLHGVLSPAGERAARIEVGHPEGYQEAFANLYKDVAEVIAARIAGTAVRSTGAGLPDRRGRRAGDRDDRGVPGECADGRLGQGGAASLTEPPAPASEIPAASTA